MSGLDGRADRLYPSLTALERAVLILQASHAGEAADWRVRGTMPEEQYAAFNGYLAQLRAVTHALSPYVLMLAQEVRLAWSELTTLAVLCQWALNRETLLRYIVCYTDEPCTQAEYEQHVLAARAEELPIALAVDAVVGQQLARSEETGGAANRQQERQLERAASTELRALVRTGTLPGHGRGSQLMLNSGAFYDWLGQPTPVPAAWGRQYAVVSDDEVASLREARERVRYHAAHGPRDPMYILPEQAASPEAVLAGAELSTHDTLLRGLASKLYADLVSLSAAYAALELVLGEVATGLGGHDPLDPDMRAIVERLGADLPALREHAEGLVGPGDATEPDAITLERLRGMVFEE